MKEQFFLVVRFWVAPEAEARLIGWLDGGHMAEVAKQRAAFEKHMKIDRFCGEVVAHA
jgi:hypothetical protein